jgi:hypothetical protein
LKNFLSFPPEGGGPLSAVGKGIELLGSVEHKEFGDTVPTAAGDPPNQKISRSTSN